MRHTPPLRKKNFAPRGKKISARARDAFAAALADELRPALLRRCDNAQTRALLFAAKKASRAAFPPSTGRRLSSLPKRSSTHLAGVLALELLAELLHRIDGAGVVDRAADVGGDLGLLPRAGDVHRHLDAGGVGVAAVAAEVGDKLRPHGVVEAALRQVDGAGAGRVQMLAVELQVVVRGDAAGDDERARQLAEVGLASTGRASKFGMLPSDSSFMAPPRS